MAGKRQSKINVHVADESALEAMRLILSYEAGVRGMSMGQACSELVMEAADVEDYPPEVRGRLAELQAESRRRAVERSLRASRGGEDDEEKEGGG